MSFQSTFVCRGGFSARHHFAVLRSFICVAFFPLPFMLRPGLTLAADGTWSPSATSGAWQTTANWISNIVPGTITGSTNTDTAIFNSTSSTTTIIPDANRNLESIAFDASAAAYTVGTVDGNPLLLTPGGTTQIANTFSGSNATETVNSPLTLDGDTTFANNSAKAGNMLVVGGAIATTGNIQRTITVSGPGTVDITGSISGLNGGMVISKTGSGLLLLSANDNNNPSLNGVVINNGSVQLGSAGALNVYSPTSMNLNGVGTSLVLAGNNNVVVSDLIGNGSILNGGTAAASIYVALHDNDVFSGSIADGAGSGPLTIGTSQSGGSLRLTGVLSNTGGVAAGGGVIILTNNNTFTGGVQIGDASVQVENPGLEFKCA